MVEILVQAKTDVNGQTICELLNVSGFEDGTALSIVAETIIFAAISKRSTSGGCGRLRRQR